MPYAAEISRRNPSCFIFVIDQSGSMSDPFGADTSRRKSDAVADAINRLLQNLVIKCARDQGVQDYFHVGVIGYGATVGPAFGGSLAGRDLVPISEVGNLPARIEERAKKVDDGAGGLVEQTIKFPIWFDAVSNNGTPMRQALNRVSDILNTWLSGHSDCFPPVVVHITDGESTDGDPSEIMRMISGLASSDGSVLLFNFHISGNSQVAPISFPDSSAALPDQYSRTLFEGASLLTPFMRSVAKEHGFGLGEGARGFVFNADLTLIIQALDIGTRPSNLR
jgi:hypothetical protein